METSKRKALCDFMAKHPRSNSQITKNADGEYDESVVEPVEWEKPLVSPDKKLPEGYLNSISGIYDVLLNLQQPTLSVLP